MRIKKHIIILIATIVLSVPAVHIKQVIQQTEESEKQMHSSIQLAIVKKAELEKKQKLEAEKLAELKRIEAEQLAAQKAAEEAEAEKQRVAAVQAEQVAERARVQAASASCGAQDPAVIFNVLVGSGVPRVSAHQILGSWKQESGFDHCQKRGDGGIAWGLNSWHPGRRQDMPSNLKDQVLWAVHTEMKRDCASCYQRVMSGSSVWDVRDAIQKSTRWGHQGSRWQYADQFASMF